MPDYSAWLIEINDSANADHPVYHQFKMDDDWTKSHDAACHFTRKQDAESVIEYYGWTRAKAVEHCWPEPAEREVIAESNGHHWIKWRHFVCCRDCGFIRRADDKNKPCRGVVTVGPR